MYCPNCGEQNSPESKFCAKCGTPLTETEIHVAVPVHFSVFPSPVDRSASRVQSPTNLPRGSSSEAGLGFSSVAKSTSTGPQPTREIEPTSTIVNTVIDPYLEPAFLKAICELMGIRIVFVAITNEYIRHSHTCLGLMLTFSQKARLPI